MLLERVLGTKGSVSDFVRHRLRKPRRCTSGRHPYSPPTGFLIWRSAAAFTSTQVAGDGSFPAMSDRAVSDPDAEAAAASAREQQRIAHDLHDGLGQLLGGDKLDLPTGTELVTRARAWVLGSG